MSKDIKINSRSAATESNEADDDPTEEKEKANAAMAAAKGKLLSKVYFISSHIRVISSFNELLHVCLNSA